MTGDNLVESYFVRKIRQVLEFHIAVAVDAGIRCSARLIGFYKFVHDLFFELRRIIQHAKRKIQPITDFRSIIGVLQGAAAPDQLLANVPVMV